MECRSGHGFAAIISALPLLGVACAGTTPVLPEPVQGNPGAEATSIEIQSGTALGFDISPDGQAIVLDLLGQLWLVPAEGGKARAITDAVRDAADDQDPTFSPDGRQIVFRSDRPGGNGLFVVATEGGPVRRLTTGTDRTPAWSSSGRAIAFMRGNVVHVLPLGATSPVPVDIDSEDISFVRHPLWLDPERLGVIGFPRGLAGRPRDSGGSVLELPVEGGRPTPMPIDGHRAMAVAVAPTGRGVAFVSLDDEWGRCLWVSDPPEPAPRRLVDRCDIEPDRIRWAPDGSAVLFVAAGRLWRADLDASEPIQIPFSARVVVPPTERPRPLVLPEPGEERPARGFMGLAIAPDGGRIAMTALGQLWLWRAGDEPRAVARVPPVAWGLSWSPDGSEIAWTSGSKGEDDLFATDVSSGETRRVTALPGRAIKPSYSPDGRWLAFVHWNEETGARVRVVPVETKVPVHDIGDTHDLGPAPPGAPWGLTSTEEVPQWSPDSDAVLVEDRLYLLSGDRMLVDWAGIYPSFVRWLQDGSLVFVFNNAVHRAGLDPETARLLRVRRLAEEPALYLTASRAGTLLYVSSDGLRLRGATGEVAQLGWPLKYTSPEARDRLLIRNARIIDGTGAPPAAGRDILIEAGRIRMIGPNGALPVVDGTRSLDARGRTVIPGLIDLHRHTWDPAQLPASLYFGITTVRDLGSPIAATAALRDAVEAGLFPGPRIVLGGLSVHLPPDDASGRPGWTTEFYQQPSTPLAGTAAVELAEAFGAGWVKLRETQDMETALTVVDHAQRRKLRVTGHALYRLPLIAAGVHGSEHGGGTVLHEDILRLAAAAGLPVVPTAVGNTVVERATQGWGPLEQLELEVFGSVWLRNRAAPFAPGRMPPEQVERYQAGVAVARQNLRSLTAAGVLIGTGTDAPSLGWSVASLHRELEELVGAGLSPLEAIVAATAHAAEILGLPHELGSIEEGKRADLLILEADPLDDIRITQRIWRVIQGGRVVDREALPTERKRGSP